MISDTELAKMAARGGIAEVKLGQLAEEKGTIQTVKDFGSAWSPTTAKQMTTSKR